MKTTQQRMIGLGGADWKWAACLPTDETLLASLCNELRAALVEGDDAAKVDEDIEWTVGEEDSRWGTVRNFKRLTTGQRRAYVIASKLAASKYLRSTGAKLVNDITTRVCFSA